MTLFEVIRDIINPAALLLPASMDSSRARVMLIAIALQESRFTHRLQIMGPARGFWQFERAGGTLGVLQHAASKKHAFEACAVRSCLPNSRAVYMQIATDDLLACCFARLLLYTDPRPLPQIGDIEGSWQYYLNNWRPGKPHRRTWNELYDEATMFVAVSGM